MSTKIPVEYEMTTTAFTLEGFHITRTYGIVHGITVRIPNLKEQLIGAVESLDGGYNKAYAEWCRTSREEAYESMLSEAEELGANAIIGVRYDTCELRDNVHEVLCYGTAVYVEPNTQ